MDFREYAANEASDFAARLTDAAAAAVDQAVASEKAAAAVILKEARSHAERLQSDLAAATDRLEAASRQLAEASRTAEKLEAARADLSAARDEQARARLDAETELRKARESVESLRGELGSAMKTLEKAAAERLASEEAAAAAMSQSQAADAKLAAVTDLLAKNAARVKSLEQAEQEHRSRVQELEAKLKDARSAPAPAAAPAAVLEELVAGFQALATATTVGEMFTTLVEQMAAQFPRVALFRLKKGHLQGEHHIGFELKTDIAKLVLPLGMDSLPSRAASSGLIETLTGAELTENRTPFSGTPQYAIAIPIVVAGETMAVIYADDSGAPGASGGDVAARYAEAMQHFAVAVLARLGNELKALAELQKYAGSLLHEMEQMYNADVEGGVSAAELQKRLAGNLDFARSIYGSRTALEGADAATLIDDALEALLESRAGTPFARDLSEALGRDATASRSQAS